MSANPSTTPKNTKNDDTILEILQGHRTSKWPAPKLVKIFIASDKQGKIFIFVLKIVFIIFILFSMKLFDFFVKNKEKITKFLLKKNFRYSNASLA